MEANPSLNGVMIDLTRAVKALEARLAQWETRDVKRKRRSSSSIVLTNGEQEVETNEHEVVMVHIY